MSNQLTSSPETELQATQCIVDGCNKDTMGMNIYQSHYIIQVRQFQAKTNDRCSTPPAAFSKTQTWGPGVLGLHPTSSILKSPSLPKIPREGLLAHLPSVKPRVQLPAIPAPFQQDHQQPPLRLHQEAQHRVVHPSHLLRHKSPRPRMLAKGPNHLQDCWQWQLQLLR